MSESSPTYVPYFGDPSTGAIVIPSGTTLERPEDAPQFSMRYNTDNYAFEILINVDWHQFALNYMG